MQDCVARLECNIDDMTGEALGFALEQVLSAGALDAWFTPIQMKKNRPAVLLTLLCREEERERFCQLLLAQTSTLGVRWHTLIRSITERAADTVTTPYGAVRRKLKMLDGQVVAIKPEYEDCARLAREQLLPLQVITDAARAIAVCLPDSGEGDPNE
ncbi:MAG: nickel pincer cofactor biosynthesis protein LarC2 [Anaerolineae bacterium]